MKTAFLPVDVGGYIKFTVVCINSVESILGNVINCHKFTLVELSVRVILN